MLVTLEQPKIVVPHGDRTAYSSRSANLVACSSGVRPTPMAGMTKMMSVSESHNALEQMKGAIRADFFNREELYVGQKYLKVQ